MPVAPQELLKLEEGKYYRLSSGEIVRRQGIAPGAISPLPGGRPAFAQVSRVPTGEQVLESPLTARDISASGTLLPKEFSSPTGEFYAKGYEAKLAQPGVPRLGTPAAIPARQAKTAEELRKELENISTTLEVPEERESMKVDRVLAGVIKGVPGKAAPPAGGLPQPPERPSYTDVYRNLQAETGATEAENELLSARTDLNALIEEIESGKRKIRGERVSSRVIGRKLTQLDAETADAISAAESRVREAQDLVSNRNRTLSTLMTLGEKSYDDARREYEFEYNKSIQQVSAFNTEQNRLRDDARAQLSVIGSYIKAGTLPVYDKMSPEFQAMVDSFSLQGYGTVEMGRLIEPSERPLGTPYTDSAGNRIQTFYNPETKETRSVIIATGLEPPAGVVRQITIDTPEGKFRVGYDKSGKEVAREPIIGAISVPRQIIGGIRQAKEENESLEEIEKFVENQGYSIDNPEIANELEGYAPEESGFLGNLWDRILSGVGIR